MLRQFKLSNGDEIIAKIVSQPDEGDEIMVSNVLKLTRVDMTRQITYHSFRPWMVMKDDVGDIISLNAFHVVAVAIPTEEMKIQYKEAVIELREMEAEKQTCSVDEWYNKLKNAGPNDSDDGNVISLYDYNKDKLH